MSIVDDPLQALFKKQVEEMEQSSSEFREAMDANKRRASEALDQALRSRQMAPASPEMAELFKLIQSNPQLAPKVLEYTKGLLAAVQQALSSVLSVTPPTSP